MTKDENWDREAELNQIFNPDDVSSWLKYSPQEFLLLIMHEIHRENDLIHGYTKILAEIPEFSSQTFKLGNKELEAAFFTDVNLSAARIIHRVLDTAAAYAKAKSGETK